MVMPYKLVSPLKILQMILFQIRDESRYNFGLKVKIFGECLVKSHKHKVEEMIQNFVPWISGFGKNDLFKYTFMKGIIKKECAMFRFYPKSKRYL